MYLEDYAAEDFKTPQDVLVYVDLMSELLARFIEQAINLKDRVEDLGCFVVDAIGPLSDREIAEHKDKLNATRNCYRDLL